MIRVIIGKWGEVLTTLNGDKELVDLNTPKGAMYVDGVAPVGERDYWDGKRFISIGEAPSLNHKFNYALEEWIDPRSLDEIKAQKWSEIKSQRDRLEFGGFEFGGNIYDSDQVSQGRIMGAAAAGVDQTWTLANNATVELIALQLQQLYAALQAHIASVHERGRIARQLIFDAETKEQVEAVNL